MNELFKKDGVIKTRYAKELLGLVEMSKDAKKVNRVHGKTWLRSRGHHTLDTSEYDRTLEILNSLGVKYTIGNDAPRGGIEGDYIEIVFDGRNKGVKFLRGLDVTYKNIYKLNLNNLG